MVKAENWHLGTAEGAFAALNSGFYFIENILSLSPPKAVCSPESVFIARIQSHGPDFNSVKLLCNGCSKEKC